MEEKRNIFTQMAVVFSVWRKNENKKCLKCYAVSFSPFLWFSTFAFIIFSILDLSTNLKQSFFFYIIIVVCTQWFPSKKENFFFCQVEQLAIKTTFKIYGAHATTHVSHLDYIIEWKFVYMTERKREKKRINRMRSLIE